MSSTQVGTEPQSVTSIPTSAIVDLKLEVMAIPVSDVDRAKAFYERLGWTLDVDVMVGKDFRAVQLTPPGSPCSIHLSTTAAPGSAQGMFLIVSDLEAARRDLSARGANVSDVFHFRRGPSPCARPRRRASVVWLIRLLHRPRRQCVDSSAGQDTAPGTRTQPRCRDTDGAASRNREAARYVRADGAQAPLVRLVCRLRGCSRARKDPR
jgi:predicted enzyme related to lactoylglutathione lyase